MRYLIYWIPAAIILIGIAFLIRLVKKKKDDRKKKIIEENQKEIVKTGVLLELSLERDSEVDVMAIDQIWRYFSSVADVDNEFFHPYLSFEVKSERDDYMKKDETTFNIWIPRRFKDMFVQKIKSVYPTILVKELKPNEDYIPDFNDSRIIARANMGLSRNFLYSLKTFDSFKEIDPVRTLVSTMSKVDNKEKAIVQILLKPINDDWKEDAKGFLKEYEIDGVVPDIKKDGFRELFMFYFVNFIKVLVTLPFDIFFKSSKDVTEKHNKMFSREEVVDKGKIENLEISNITDKITCIGYSVDIRVLVCTPYGRKKAEDLLDQICSSFKEIDGDNRLVKKPVPDIKQFMTNVKARWYPFEVDNDILSTKEVSMFCHFPNSSNSITLKQITTKIIEAPPGLSAENILGFGYRNGQKIKIGIDGISRFRHMWVGGQTGTGKSTIMENMIYNDIANGQGLMLIDPHGETALHTIERCPSERKDIYYLNIADLSRPPSINLFEVFNSDYELREQEKSQICENFIVIFKRIFGSESIGPNTED